MTALEAFRLLRANPTYESISDSVLHGLIKCVNDTEEALVSELQLTGIKRHLKEFMQYYA
ncbi:hypothetical protein GCM10011369_01820 [Neiella marina]|uniref:Uncharacterized protein n=1 Tax=Neiella marina TaxID=508461 RepID=A0A8J2U1Q8_9GAMM|nr:hypothetical protein [Neiella marina]GGA64052.1 hypothetical protein GCM10011369_01820 [Neiella marina]